MNVTQAGFPCVALLGATMSRMQEELLNGFGRVVVMVDGEEAGRVAAEGIADRLQRLVYKVDTAAVAHNAQADQLSFDEFRQLLDGFSVMH